VKTLTRRELNRALLARQLLLERADVYQLRRLKRPIARSVGSDGRRAKLDVLNVGTAAPRIALWPRAFSRLAT